MTNNPSETVLSLVASDVERPVSLASIEALHARLASPSPEGVALDHEEVLTLLRGMALVSTMALADRDRYRLAWHSARSRATHYRELNAVHAEALTESRRRAADLAQAVLDGTPREELVELITGRGQGVRLAVVQDAAVPSSAELAESLGSALAAMLPDAEPVYCHHENARRSTRETMQAGWGRNTIVRLDCPVCHEWAERVNGEPILAPKVINVSRCTEACTEQHTYRDGCLMAPDWSKPILRSEP